MSTDIDPRHYIAALLRVVAVCIFVYWLYAVTVVLRLYLEVGEMSLSPLVLAPYLLPPFVATFLWKFPAVVATKIWPGPISNISNQVLTPHTFCRLCFVLFGIILCFWSISDTAYLWAFTTFQGGVDPYGAPIAIDLGATNKAVAFATAIEFVFALLLIVGSNKLASFVLGTRHG